ncbi:MAG: alkaline phosphatase family protein [Gemmatimonadota bacterium]
MSAFKRVIVVGLDGLEPAIVDRLLAAGALPNLARLQGAGGYSRVATTSPAQTPVAWSTFATGVNPGGHGIFDFVRRDPQTYLPDLGLNRYEQKSAFLPPKAINLRRGTPVWEILARAGFPSAVLRCPCTYPPDKVKGRLLSGMGVPDLRGGLGTGTFYTADDTVKPGESETVIHLAAGAGPVTTHLIGPRNPKSGDDARLEFTIELDAAGRRAVIRSKGDPSPLELREGAWSDWLKLKFKLGALQSVSGMVRFYLSSCEPLAVYASPLNFEPDSPMFPISAPWDYAGELQRKIGTYYTTGMIEDHTGLNNERFGEDAFLEQCAQVVREREAMLHLELDRQNEGLVYCLFDTPDRIQHMFWRFGEPGHPANRGRGDGAAYANVIDDHYQSCDAIVGRVLERADDRTLVIVLSDHGFGSFQRGVHLNTILLDHGFLTLKPGIEPGHGAGDFLREVDWAHTKAYALGLGSIYLNVRGREAEGIIPPDQAGAVGREIAAALGGAVDPERGEVAVRSVSQRADIYAGAYLGEAPDLVVNFSRGYRVSWGSGLGEVPAGHFEDNAKKWSGDHIVDPALVPGVLFRNRPFSGEAPRLLDLAPTILAALGAPADASHEGASLL